MALQTLIFAGQRMEDNRQLKEYHVPPVRLTTFISITRDPCALLTSSVCPVAVLREAWWQGELRVLAGMPSDDCNRDGQTGLGQTGP